MSTNNQPKITAKQIFKKKFVRQIFHPQKPKQQSLAPQNQKTKKKCKDKEQKVQSDYLDDCQLQILAQSINMKVLKNNSVESFEDLQSESAENQKKMKGFEAENEKESQNEKNSAINENQKTTISQKAKSRAKIFKQELMDSISAQQKTSLHRWSFGDGHTSSKIVIGNWNVNGMRSVYTKKYLFNYINTRKPDILCITETKMDQKSFDQSPIKLDGYQSYWNFSKCSAGYSGVVVFSKFLPKKGTEDMLEREHSQEGRMLTLQFQKFFLINVYFPTSGKELERLQYRKRYDTAFRNHIKNLQQSYPDRPILIVGDLNVAHTELDTHPGKNIINSPSFTLAQRKGLTELLNMGFTDVYRALNPNTRAYTWWYVNIGGRQKLETTGLGRRIDYFLVTSQNMRWVKKCQILRQFLGADHCPLEMEIDLDL